MSKMSADEFQHEVEIPLRVFFYTVDQIAYMLDCSESYLRTDVLYYVGRSHGIPAEKLRAINLAGPEDVPNWRVSEQDFIAWLKMKKISLHVATRPGRVRRR